jgi:hypothetical protein
LIDDRLDISHIDARRAEMLSIPVALLEKTLAG